MGILNNLTLVPQGEHPNWCWASVTGGICSLLDGRPYTLEQIVSTCLNDPTCAMTPTPDSCDMTWPLSVALTTMGHFGGQIGGSMSFAALQQQIDNLQLPVAIEVTFPTVPVATRHACVVKGCFLSGGSQEVLVLNPLSAAGAQTQVSFDDLVAGATLGGPWTDSFTIVL